MKVCHVTSVHKFPDVRIFHKECLSLSKKYEVHLVTSNVEDGLKEGVFVHGVKLPNNRILRYLELRKVYQTALKIDADVYHFHDPELIKIGIALKRKGKIIIFDSHEDIPLDIAEKEWMPFVIRKLLSYYYERLEKWAFKRYDALVSVTPSIVDKLKVINPNTYQITNYPHREEFEDKRTWNKTICFTGLISSSWMHDNIIKALSLTDIKYEIAGPGSQDYINKLKSSADNVSYVGVLKRNDVKSFVQRHLVGMALYDYLPSFGYKKGSLGNNKIFEYMSAGIPVIGTDFDLWKEVIEGNGCGICVNPHDIDAIKNAIKYLIEHPEEAKRMGDNGVKITSEHYNWSSQEKILFDMYDKVLNQ